MSHKNFFLIAGVGVACFIAGIFFSQIWASSTPKVVNDALRAGKGTYTYINPLLLCRIDENGEFSEFFPLKKEIERITSTAQNSGTIISGSVYFRDLLNGRWTGVHENDLYSPASLLKVPILIAYLKASEKDPNLLSERTLYTQEPGQAPPLVTNPILISGRKYTVEDLMRGMIIDSDNSAKTMLEGGLDEQFLSEAYSELGIPSPYRESESSAYQISTRTYALFFRILYNATFLNHETSERALEMLASVAFDKGLKAGTPADIAIAHKYGYSIIKRDQPSIIELSDCGIVYDTDRPYLLCVVARGADPETTATYIRDIAAAAYRITNAD